MSIASEAILDKSMPKIKLACDWPVVLAMHMNGREASQLEEDEFGLVHFKLFLSVKETAFHLVRLLVWNLTYICSCLHEAFLVCLTFNFPFC